ncbi:hypothetical protein AVEN_185404-1 [Araneus ventricosus]|uniref:Uncharacterized protein n=1 Tax=Araneus ventricosus TaxID=182803 RepID=A0A4Y2CJG9_ARAVE|nr:hypothetical protein AVEN_185404-1 [Araneus ventricosus]
MLNLWQEREFYIGFTRSQANDLRPRRQFWRLGDKFGNFCDKTKLLENRGNFALSLLGAEISRTFERLLCDVTSFWKRYKKQALKPRVNQLELGQHFKMMN